MAAAGTSAIARSVTSAFSMRSGTLKTAVAGNRPASFANCTLAFAASDGAARDALNGPFNGFSRSIAGSASARNCSARHRCVLRDADDILRVETDFQGCGAGVSKDRKRRSAELDEPCERRVRDRFGRDSNDALIALWGADENRRAATQLSGGPFHEMVGREERRTTRPGSRDFGRPVFLAVMVWTYTGARKRDRV